MSLYAITPSKDEKTDQSAGTIREHIAERICPVALGIPAKAKKPLKQLPSRPDNHHADERDEKKSQRSWPVSRLDIPGEEIDPEEQEGNKKTAEKVEQLIIVPDGVIERIPHPEAVKKRNDEDQYGERMEYFLAMHSV